MSKHMPGPWKTRKGFRSETIEIYAPDKDIKKPFRPTELATVQTADKKGKANAKLIAAAPELLEALYMQSALIAMADKVLLNYLVPNGISQEEAINQLLGIFDGPTQREFLEKTIAAIAKATGGVA